MSDPVTYTAVLPVSEQTTLFLSRLLAAERRRRGTRGRRRALGCYRQAVLALRWLLDGTRLAQLAADNLIGSSTAYRYLHEGIDVLAAAAPGLRGALLLAARIAGHAHMTVDGTLIRTDRCQVPGPTARTDRSGRQSGRQVDLWWSGKHACHGGNVQVIAAPEGCPLWTSGVRPGREHDTTALRTHAEVLPLLGEWPDTEHAALADLGYEGERAALTTPIKKTSDVPLTDDRRTVNLLHAVTPAPAERGNSLLKTTFKALRRVSLCPWRIGAITAAALVLLHHEVVGRRGHRPGPALLGMAHCLLPLRRGQGEPKARHEATRQRLAPTKAAGTLRLVRDRRRSSARRAWQRQLRPQRVW